MKKLIALVLALVMALSLTTVAWGAGEVAEVGSTQYTDLQAAIDDAELVGGTVKLLDDVTLSLAAGQNYCLQIDAPITIDGNNKTLTFSGAYDSRAINIKTTGNVTIKNLTVTTNGERGIQVAGSPVKLTLENVTATSANYTLNVTESAGAAKIALNNCTLTGLCTVNVWGAGSEVTISGGKIVCNDQNPAEGYRALSLNSTATGATITATGVDFDIKGDSGLASNATTDGEVMIDGSNSGVRTFVASVQYGDYAYYFSTVQDAIDHAVANSQTEVVVLDTAINSGESYTPAAGVTVTMPAGANLVQDAAGRLTVVSSTGSTTSYDKADVTIINKAGSKVAIADGAKVVMTAENKKTVNGKFASVIPAYFTYDGVNYVVCHEASATHVVTVKGVKYYTCAFNGVVPSVEKDGGVLYTAPKKATCGKVGVNEDKYVVIDNVYYLLSDSGTNYALVGGKMVVYSNTTGTMQEHVYDAVKSELKYNTDRTVATFKCAVCNNTIPVVAKKPNFATNYTAITLGNEGIYYYVSNTTGTTVSGGTTTGGTVNSADTFDAGIAMYVGMSVMAAAGSAVVIGKKKD